MPKPSDNNPISRTEAAGLLLLALLMLAAALLRWGGAVPWSAR